MNESGAVAGVWKNSANNRHAFHWDPSRGAANMLDLGTLGGAQSAADGGYNADGPIGRPINAGGQVVGWAQTKSQTVAFVWSPATGQMQNLNGPLSGKSPFSTLQGATSINDAGQIVGYGTAGGQTRAFLLTP
jgi:probable HAF family extracellular repeat protein